jgi:xylan 1,4-beta-xylosidase
MVLEAADLDELEWKPVWLEQFLTFCQREHLPLDFVSCHPYPTDWALDEHGQGSKLTRGAEATPTDLALLRRMIDESAFPDVEIHLTEWNSSSSPRDFTHDYLQAATYIVRANVGSIGTVDSLAYWTFTDVFEEGGAGDTIFHGGFGMINYQGIVKPSYHAYRFLSQLGDELLDRSPSSVLTRHRTKGKLTALAWHYPPEMPLSVPASFDTRDKAKEVLDLGSDEILKIDLTGLTPHTIFLAEVLDRDHGNAMAAWEAMGSPEPPSREQTTALRDAASATKKLILTADEAGNLQAQIPMAPWAVVLLREA